MGLEGQWIELTLGEILTLQRGFDLPHRQRKSGAIPIVSSSGISGHHSTALAFAPGVVTGRYGTIGEVFYINEDYWPLNTTLYVKDFKGNDPKFIYFILKTIDFEMHSGKSGVPGVNRNDLHTLDVLLPPLPEQHAIAEALSDVDELIGQLERLAAKKQAIKQGAMQNLLTGRQRLPGFKGEWEENRLGDVLRVRHGKNQKAVSHPEGTFPIFATGGEIGRATQFLYNRPSVLIGRKGTIDEPRYADKPFWTVDTLFYTEIFSSCNAKFVFYLFNTINWLDYNEASGVPSLNAKVIENIEVQIPPLPEQQAIASILSDMDAEIAALKQCLTKTRALKQGMMQELLTGRIRLIGAQ